MKTPFTLLATGLLLSSLLLASCMPIDLPAPTGMPEPTGTQTARPTDLPTAAPTETFTPAPTDPPTPDPTPTLSPTPIPTPFSLGEPGLVATLGETVNSPWRNGVPAFSPDGQTIVLAGKQIRLWDVTTLELVGKYINPDGSKCRVGDAGFSSDGSYLAVSVNYCPYEQDPNGHLLIYETATGELLHDWTQVDAILEEPGHSTYSMAVEAFAFLPHSTQIAYGSGTRIEIRDVRQGNEPPVILDLGERMFASYITVPGDGAALYVLMHWFKMNTWPASYKEKFTVKIWDLANYSLAEEIDFPDYPMNDVGFFLCGDQLIYYDYHAGTATRTDLPTGHVRAFPFRLGWKYWSPDMQWMAAARYFGFDEKDRKIELFHLDTWRNPYSFDPAFRKKWETGLHSISFSPDNTLLAISHNEQVSLWNISQVVNP
jgi:WD40 repeat protein